MTHLDIGVSHVIQSDRFRFYVQRKIGTLTFRIMDRVTGEQVGPIFTERTHREPRAAAQSAAAELNRQYYAACN